VFSLLAACACAGWAEAAPSIRLVEFDAPLTPLNVLRITRAIDDAETAGDAFVLIELDTPGGLVDSTEAAVKRMLAARVPIVVWVGPAGAKAASGGFFLLIAADVAAMAPGTRTGAAKTVFGVIESAEENRGLKKMDQDLAALARSIAARRGRDPKACEDAVFEARSYEESVALERRIVDLVVPTREALLAALDGRDVKRFDGTTTKLQTAGAGFVVTQFSLRHRFLETLATPILATLLLFAGLLGLYVEFTHPGVVFPGVVGALCLLLFALTAQVLPMSTIGILLVALGLLMFLLEIKVTSYGMLTVGGAACLLLGGFLLIDAPIPELRVPLTFLVPLAAAVTLVAAVAVRLAVRSQRVPVVGMLGEIGTVLEDLAPTGRVFVHGEIWTATAAGAPIVRGERVRVKHAENLRLVVEPAGAETPEPPVRT
jgi:membrane-bound serine protease (ClpP class)